MDSFTKHLGASFASNASDFGVDHSTIAAMRLDSPGLLSPNVSNSKVSKRKWGVNDTTMNPQRATPLVLSLGYSSSSCISFSSVKEIEEETSTDFGPSINLRMANDKTLSEFVCSRTLNRAELEKPKLDLELSLSTGYSDSDVTTVTQGFNSLQNNRELPGIAGMVQLMDEGSTSSRWKLGPLVPPLPAWHNNPTLAIPNLTSNVEIVPDGSVACAYGVTQQQQRRNTCVKTCQFTGCTRGARGASGFCIAHGGGRRCKRAGCQKGAEGKTVFCKAHGGGRRCQHLGCTKSAEGRTDFCIGHGGGRRCSHEGCGRAARGKSGLCIRHGGGKRCRMENCTKSAEGISGLCISHGGGRRCQHPTCTKGAQGSTKFCKAHGGGKRCTYVGCTKGAEGSTLFCKAHGGGKRCSYDGGCTRSVHGGTLFCVNHGGGKRCAAPECTKSARGRTNFCVRHGGGKRCKSEGCGKSAQGSTDFCKAHGGGKRCHWGRMGLEFGGQAAEPCDKFARGKSGLCAAHSAEMQDKQIHHGGGTLVHALHDPYPSMTNKMIVNNHAKDMKAAVGGNMNSHGQLPCIPVQILAMDAYPSQNPSLLQFSLPEGRVHGGSLMAMLRGSTKLGESSNQAVGGPSESGTSFSVPHGWV